MIAIRGSLVESEAKTAYSRLTQYLEKNGGKLTYEEPWGKIGLAYKITQETEAHYFVLHMMYDTQKIENLEEFLQIDNDVIRSLLTKIEDDYKPFTKAQYEEGMDAYRATKQERQKVAMPKTRATTAVQLEADMKKMVKNDDSETKINAIIKDLDGDL